MTELLSWALPITAILALIALGFNALQVVSSTDEFWIARGWFILAAIVALVRVIIWGVTTSRDVTLRLVVGVIACGFIVGFAVEGVRYVNRKRNHWIDTSTKAKPPEKGKRLDEDSQSGVTQPVKTSPPEKPLNVARQVLAKQPVLEYKGHRFIRRPIDLRDNTLGDRDYADSELAYDVKNVGVALARFYYKPDVDVPPSLYVRAHIEFRDADGEVTTVNDAMWHKEDDKYREFNTGDSHELIVALIPIGSKDRVLTYEHNLQPHEAEFTKSHGFTTEHLAPEIGEMRGKEFNFGIELIGKSHEQVMVTKNFNFKLTLEPEPRLEEIKPTDALTDAATPLESQAKREYIIERLKELISQHGQLPIGIVYDDDPRFGMWGGIQKRCRASIDAIL
jgi:hypothetical protein